MTEEIKRKTVFVSAETGDQASIGVFVLVRKLHDLGMRIIATDETKRLIESISHEITIIPTQQYFAEQGDVLLGEGSILQDMSCVGWRGVDIVIAIPPDIDLKNPCSREYEESIIIANRRCHVFTTAQDCAWFSEKIDKEACFGGEIGTWLDRKASAVICRHAAGLEIEQLDAHRPE